jgi:hypothetical protein
MPKKNQKAEK